MRQTRLWKGTVVLALMLNGSCHASAFDDFFHELGKVGQKPAASNNASLSDQEVKLGLKDALSEGANKAVAVLGRPDGLWKNDLKGFATGAKWQLTE